MKHNITLIIISWVLFTLAPCFAANSLPLSKNNEKNPLIYIAPSIKYQLLNLNLRLNQPIKPGIISMGAYTTKLNTQHMKDDSKHTLELPPIKLHKSATTNELNFIKYQYTKSLKEKHYGAWRNDSMQANFHINID